MAPDLSNDASCFLEINANYGIWINSETRTQHGNNIQFGLLLFSLKFLMLGLVFYFFVVFFFYQEELGLVKKVGHGFIIDVWLSSEYASDNCNVSFQLEIFISLSCITLFSRVASWQYTLDIGSKNSCSGNTIKNLTCVNYSIYVSRF